MRQGEYDVQVMRSDWSPFHEVYHDGRCYVVAAPGEVFTVQVTRRNRAGLVVVRLTIDGKPTCNGFSTSFSRPPLTFRGWLEARTATSRTTRDFVFAGAKEDAGRAAPHSLDFKEGKIEVKVYQATDTGIPSIHSHDTKIDNIREAVVPKLGEDKKFFLQPALVCGIGAKTTEPIYRSETRIDSGALIATLQLQYDTPTTLLLRGILKRGDPRHDAILDSFPETRLQTEEGEEEGQGGGRTRVKRECIDLANEPNPGDEVLAAVRAGKVLCCDLTEEDGAPQWAAVKRARR